MAFDRNVSIITPIEMSAIDSDAARSGIDSFRLMTSAGLAVSAAALRLYPQALRFVVLCGPGNNGGDGYITAAALQSSGAEVTVHALGDTAHLKGDAARAHAQWMRSVEAFEAYRPKPGDVVIDALFGAGLSRAVPERILRNHTSGPCENGPHLWAAQARVLDPSAHKFKRGHLAIFSGGPLSTGAARLSAVAGLKAGAGLVTLASTSTALTANAAHLTAVMLKEVEDTIALSHWLADKRISAFVLGPGFGDLERARQYALMLSDRALVLDADGITAFKDNPAPLFDAFAGGETRLVMTPHEGEFARLFADIDADPTLSKVDRAIAAAKRSNAVIVYKGADTVIASPDGRAAINTNAPPWLATAGSGDTLAGIIGAHLAQGMPAFEAAAAGVWRHGRAGTKAGEGLTAEDLAAAIEPLPAAS
jgi:hydroxyethylthiazole kinase-like uncharacterized protein yjeF